MPTEIQYLSRIVNGVQRQVDLSQNPLDGQAEYNNGNSGSVNFLNGPAQLITLNANTTISFSNSLSGSAYVIRFVQGSGSYTVSWPAGTKWPGGTAPTISTANGAIDLVNLYYDGTNYYGTFAQTFS